MTKLSERLLALRQELNLSQKTLAREMGLAPNTYVRYERGEREPTASVLVQMADFYDVSLDYLVGRSDQRNWPPSPAE